MRRTSQSLSVYGATSASPSSATTASIGRFDPKLERRASTLHLRRLHLEPGIRPEDEIVADIAAAMRSFMAFHDATDLVIEHSKPRGLRRKLLKAI